MVCRSQEQAGYEAWQGVRKEKKLDSPDTKEALLAMQAYRASSEIVDFKYGDDIKGYKCPSWRASAAGKHKGLSGSRQ